MRLEIRSQKRSILEEELLGFRHQNRSVSEDILVLFLKENSRRILEGILEEERMEKGRVDGQRGGHGEDFGGGHSARRI